MDIEADTREIDGGAQIFQPQIELSQSCAVFNDPAQVELAGREHKGVHAIGTWSAYNYRWVFSHIHNHATGIYNCITNRVTTWYNRCCYHLRRKSYRSTCNQAVGNVHLQFTRRNGTSVAISDIEIGSIQIKSSTNRSTTLDQQFIEFTQFGAVQINGEIKCVWMIYQGMNPVFARRSYSKVRRTAYFDDDFAVSSCQQITDYIATWYIRLGAYGGQKASAVPVVDTWRTSWVQSTRSDTACLLTVAHHKISTYRVNRCTNGSTILDEGLFHRFEHGHSILDDRSWIPGIGVVDQSMDAVTTCIAHRKVGAIAYQ